MKHKLLFLYLVAFPFGQLAKVNVNFLGSSVPVVAIDVIGILLFILCIFDKSRPKIWFYFKALMFVFAFSFVLSLPAVALAKAGAFSGSFYLLRLLSTSGVFLAVWSLVKDKKLSRKKTLDCMILIAVFIAIFGWVQYALVPNFRPFTIWGWDDHLHRLIGTFLDPGFTSILLVFGFLASLASFLTKREKFYFWASAFLFASILFTYSRAGYIAMVFGTAYLLRKNLRLLALGILLLAFSVLALPKPYGEGVNLTRTYSIEARLENYRQTFEIFKNSPLLGIGYNNLCLYKQEVFSAELSSHSCGGADSSILLILATTGIIGFLMISCVVIRMVGGVKRDIYGKVFLASGLSLLVHSLFVGSIFYPWVLGWLLIVFAMAFSL